MNRVSENKTADRTDSRWELVVTSKTMKLWAWGSAAVVMAVIHESASFRVSILWVMASK